MIDLAAGARAIGSIVCLSILGIIVGWYDISQTASVVILIVSFGYTALGTSAITGILDKYRSGDDDGSGDAARTESVYVYFGHRGGLCLARGTRPADRATYLSWDRDRGVIRKDRADYWYGERSR
jgi:hypothetical protein